MPSKAGIESSSDWGLSHGYTPRSSTQELHSRATAKDQRVYLPWPTDVDVPSIGGLVVTSGAPSELVPVPSGDRDASEVIKDIEAIWRRGTRVRMQADGLGSGSASRSRAPRDEDEDEEADEEDIPEVWELRPGSYIKRGAAWCLPPKFSIHGYKVESGTSRPLDVSFTNAGVAPEPYAGIERSLRERGVEAHDADMDPWDLVMAPLETDTGATSALILNSNGNRRTTQALSTEGRNTRAPESPDRSATASVLLIFDNDARGSARLTVHRSPYAFSLTDNTSPGGQLRNLCE